MNNPPVGVSAILVRLMQYRVWLLAVPIAFGLAGGIYSKLQPPVFTAYARLLPPQTNASSATALLSQIGGGAAVGAAALTLKNPSDLYAGMLTSRTVQDDAIDHFQLQKHYHFGDVDLLRVEVLKRTKVEVGKDGIITLSYSDHVPKMAADVANGLIEGMYRLATRLARQDDFRRMAFYDGLIVQARGAQAVADSVLRDLEIQTGLTRLKGQEENSTTAMAELRGMIATREVEFAKSSQTATARHPEMIRMQLELGALRAQLGRMESLVFGNPGYAKNRTQGLNSTTKSQDQFLPFNEYAQRRALVEPARRDVENAQSVVAQLVKAREFSRGDETRDLSVLQVLDAAVPPTRKSGPRVTLITIGSLAIGLLLSAMTALSWDILFSNVERRERWKWIFIRFSQPDNKAQLPRKDGVA